MPTPLPSPSETLRAQLEAQLASVRDTVQALQQEAQELPGEVRREVQERVTESPLVAVGGALVLGLAAGWVVNRLMKAASRSPKPAIKASTHLDHWANAIAQRLRKGASIEDAVASVVGKQTPVVVVQANGSADKGGIASQVLRAGFGLVTKMALQEVTRRLSAQEPVK